MKNCKTLLADVRRTSCSWIDSSNSTYIKVLSHYDQNASVDGISYIFLFLLCFRWSVKSAFDTSHKKLSLVKQRTKEKNLISGCVMHINFVWIFFFFYFSFFFIPTKFESIYNQTKKSLVLFWYNRTSKCRLQFIQLKDHDLCNCSSGLSF